MLRALCIGFAFCFLWGPVTARPSTTPVVLPVTGHQCDGPLENSVSAKTNHARELAANYFAGMGFVLEVQDIARKVELFCTRESTRQAVAAAFHAEESEIPATFSGTVQNATLFVVSRQLYKENFVGLYGADLWNDTEYDKLMTHEMVHSAHALVAKRLFGSEDGMGPQWLFEGLAIDASGQLRVSKDELRKVTIRDLDDFLQAAEKGNLKAPVYIQYAVFYTYVRQFVSNKWIVENAGKPDVIDLIHRAIQAQAH